MPSCQFLAAFFESLFSHHSPQPLFGNSLISFYAPKPLKMYIKIRPSSLKPMFTPNHWHQTVVCYQATSIYNQNKLVSKLTTEADHVKRMTLMIHRLKNTTSMTVSSSEKLWDATLEYVMELREKLVSFCDVN